MGHVCSGGVRMGYKTPRYWVRPNGQEEGEEDRDNSDDGNDLVPLISLEGIPIWLTWEEKRKLHRQSRYALGAYLRNPTRPQTLHREERDEKVACWWTKFYTDIAKMKEREVG